LNYFNKALELNPQFDQAWHNKGQSLLYLERYEEALNCINNALNITPDDLIFLNDKGLILLKLEQYKESLSCFNEVLDSNPQYYQTSLIKVMF